MFNISIDFSQNNLENCLDHLVKNIHQANLTIYSYTGDEKHNPIYYEETKLFKDMLEKAHLKCAFVEISDDLFFPSTWDSKQSVLHIPGALSTELDKHLGSKVAEIKEFVCRGGKFLGWCGGGYWACRSVHYIDTQTILNKTRELALWKGIEEGPLMPFLGNPEGTIGFFHGAVKINWPGSNLLKNYFPEGLQLNVLLSGGGSFIPSEQEYSHQVLATYEEVIEEGRSLAGVKTYVDKGMAILMNPYFTHGADYLEQGLEGYEKYFPQHSWRQIVEDLKGAELKSLLCFVDILYEFTQTKV